MNIKLLRQVKKQILNEPKQFAMDNYFMDENNKDTPARIPNCGTAACIAGWAETIRLGMTPKQAWRASFYFDPSETLGINFHESERLFWIDGWPNRYAKAYKSATCKHQWARRARIAANRIEHFIKTKGAE